MTVEFDGTNPLAQEPIEANRGEADEAGPSQEPDTAIEPEDEEIDWEDGKKYRIPKAIKPALLRTADYTRKTQEVARERDTLKAERTAFEQQTAASREHIKDIAQLQGLDDWLGQMDQVNWQQWEMENPQEAQAAWRQRELAKDARAKLATKIEAGIRQSIQTAQQETAKRRNETAAYAQQNIPGWTPQMDLQITQFAQQELGFTPDELVGLISPKTYRTLHRLWALEQAAKKSPPPTAPEAADVAVTPLSPPARGRAPANAGPRPSQSIDDWMAARTKQIAARRKG